MKCQQPFRSFNTIDQVNKFLERRECNNRYTYTMRRSKKITENIQKTRKYKIKTSLIYASILAKCTYGGVYVPKTQTKDKQRCKGSSKIDCPAFFNILPSKNGQQLQLRDYDLTHTCRRQKPNDLNMTPQELWSPNTSMQDEDFIVDKNDDNDRDSGRENDNDNEDKESSKDGEKEHEDNEKTSEDGAKIIEDNDDEESSKDDEQTSENDGKVIEDDEETSEDDDEKVIEDDEETSEDDDEKVIEDDEETSEDDDEKVIEDDEETSEAGVDANKSDDEKIHEISCNISNINIQENEKQIIQDTKDTHINKNVQADEEIASGRGVQQKKNRTKYYDLLTSGKSKVDENYAVENLKMSVNGQLKGRLTKSEAKKKIKLPKPFVEKTKNAKINMILSEIFGRTMCKKLVKGELFILNTDLPETYSSLPDFIVDSSIDLDIIKSFFKTKKAFAELTKLVKQKKKSQEYSCKKCREEIEEDTETINCDGCLYWFHFTCVKVSTEDILPEKWFCSECQSSC